MTISSRLAILFATAVSAIYTCSPGTPVVLLHPSGATYRPSAIVESNWRLSANNPDAAAVAIRRNLDAGDTAQVAAKKHGQKPDDYRDYDNNVYDLLDFGIDYGDVIHKPKQQANDNQDDYQVNETHFGALISLAGTRFTIVVVTSGCNDFSLSCSACTSLSPPQNSVSVPTTRSTWRQYSNAFPVDVTAETNCTCPHPAVRARVAIVSNVVIFMGILSKCELLVDG